MQIRQIKALTIANMKARYRKTLAGFLWVVLNPIIMYSVQSFVFSKFLKLSMPNYATFLLGGLLPWIFITSSLEICTPLLFASSELLKGFKLSPFVILSSQILDNFVNFLFAFTIVFLPILFYSKSYSIGLLLLPLAVLLLITTVWAGCWLLSVMHIFFRDTKFVVSFLVNIMFFLTPIFYPIYYVPERYRWLVEFNPLFNIIRPFRICLYQFDFNTFFLAFGRGMVTCLIIIGISIWFWRSKRNEFYLYL